MDVKRIFRGPWFWIVLAVVGVLVALQYLVPNGGYEEVKTSTMSAYIADGKVKDITFIDQDQEIRATLDDDKKVLTHWVDGPSTAELPGRRATWQARLDALRKPLP